MRTAAHLQQLKGVTVVGNKHLQGRIGVSSILIEDRDLELTNTTVNADTKCA